MYYSKEIIDRYTNAILSNNLYVKNVNVNLKSYNGNPYYILTEIPKDDDIIGETYYLCEKGISYETRGKSFEEYYNNENSLWIKNSAMFSYYLSL